jgi:chromosome segregation ATPase
MRKSFFSLFRQQLPASVAAVPVPVAAPVEPIEPSQADTLAGQLAAVTAERDMNAAAFADAKSAYESAINALNTDLAAVKATAEAAAASITALTTERDSLKAAVERDREAIRQEIRQQEMATLAASQGIPAGADMVAVGTGVTSKTDELEVVLAEMKAATSPAARGLLAAKAAAIRADIRAGK